MNRLTTREQWRAETVYVGIQWYPTKTGYAALELRNDASHNTSSRPVCTVRAYLDGYTATCMGCGREFDADNALSWLGRFPEGICCCSAECKRRFEEDARMLCEVCGCAAKTISVTGEHMCWLCASRAYRAHFESERHDTIPAPPPTTRDDYRLETTAAAPVQFSAAE